jgi:hypothetical protein
MMTKTERHEKIIIDQLKEIGLLKASQSDLKAQVLAWLGYNKSLFGIDENGDEYEVALPKEVVAQLQSIVEGNIEYPKGKIGYIVGDKVHAERG